MSRCAAVLIVVIFAGAIARNASASSPQSQFGGTFIQLTRAHGSWTDAQWLALFAEFRALHITELVVQWSVYDDVPFYGAAAGSPAPRSPLSTILQLADRANLTVFVGLVEDPRFWSRIQRDPALVDVYLHRLRARSEETARDLMPLVRAHASFVGWYISQEIDDVSWHAQPAWDVLRRHLCALTAMLRELTPSARIAISGFTNGFMDPERLAARWAGLTADARLELMLQDGIGAGKLQLEDLAPYYAAIHAALDGHARFHIIVETFAEAPDGSTMRLRPAPLARILSQLSLAARYSTEPLVAFSVPDYMAPSGGTDAVELNKAYRQALPRR
jgi:hypothetical protein